MSNLPILVAVFGVTALLFAILKDILFDPSAILVAILGIVIGSLITCLVVGERV